MTESNKNPLVQLENVNIQRIESLYSPAELKKELGSSKAIRATVLESRNTINRILSGSDMRMLGIVGPCSIHDRDAALEYATKFKKLRDMVLDKMYLIMRVYFEKPRTTLGWRGLLIDPDMNNTNDISKGLRLGRKILLDINGIGVPAGSEYLDPVVPNYVDDLICWASIGARTIESQTHRDMASGVSVPVGLKNSTDGGIESAVNAMVLSSTPRGFIGIDADGDTSIVHTRGNNYTHLILRGGRSGPNYFPHHIEEAREYMKKMNRPPLIVVDCSHGNSLKDHRNQSRVLDAIIEQRIAGQKAIIGFMLESNLKEGRQNLDGDIASLEYGKSLTDACISFEETEEIIMKTYNVLGKYDLHHTSHVKYGL